MTPEKDDLLVRKILISRFIRLIAPVLLIAILFILTVFLIVIPAMQKSLMDEKREKLKELCQSVCRMLESIEAKERMGELTREEAQKLAFEEVKWIRYGPEMKDYFWINDIHCRMIVHPTRPEFVGTDMTDFSDYKGKRILVEFVRTAVASGGGYVDYMWQRDDPSKRIALKISYVKSFKPWGLVVGTGVFVEDVETQIANVTHRFILYSGGILVIMLVLSFYTIRHGIEREKERQKAEEALRKANEQLEEKVGERTVELRETNTRLQCKIAEHMQAEEERKKLELQLLQAQKLESIGQLAAGIAHEINTPIQYVGDNIRFLLGAFNDFSELLDRCMGGPAMIKKGISPDELEVSLRVAAEKLDIEYLRSEVPLSIQQSLDGVGRVREIVLAMKEFSYPDSHDKKAVNINHLISSTVTVARNEWKYVAEMAVDLDSSMPLVPCHPGEFNQVILNMIVNAAQAIAARTDCEPKGKGIITIRTRHDDKNAQIHINDTGIGIPENIRTRIFDPFFTTKEVGKGTGQGLAIAHSVIVGKHGGRISFESETGRGTTFVITMPIF